MGTGSAGRSGTSGDNPHAALRRWIFGSGEAERFTQDSPVLPRVWLEYHDKPGKALDLLLTPEAKSSSARLAKALLEALGDDGKRTARLAYNESYVVASLTFDQLVRIVVPLSAWWAKRDWGRRRSLGRWVKDNRNELVSAMADGTDITRSVQAHGDLAWYAGLVGRIRAQERHSAPAPEDAADAAADVLSGLASPSQTRQPVPLVWRVGLNRAARTTVARSREAVKADAATRLFEMSCRELRWAIVDTGVDATHPAFRRRDPSDRLMRLPAAGEPGEASRVVYTYDFTLLRDLMCRQVDDPAAQRELDLMEERLRYGRAVDWEVLKPLLLVPHARAAAARSDAKRYERPTSEHGTHVAGILAGDWRTTDGAERVPGTLDLRGICPDIELYDLRVFRPDGSSDEFTITAALQFVRHLNSHSDLQVIHGLNLSLAIDHDVKNYACGRTPVCDECDRLVRTGVVVVVAAGNEGRAEYASEAGIVDGYRTTSITDPGNAALVITVGATHRTQAHTYGISYFSSRGPTGDGRRKPDLVAPGEKIEAPVPAGDAKVKDGTSQAAPHVSGAAALLMARYEELRAQPLRVKELLCETATDLGREHYFQGAGMVDVLRALQAV